MKPFYRKAAVFSLSALFFAVCLTFFVSCGSTLGWSVLLWNNEEHQIADGTIVRVYIKSNISHVYVVSIPGSKQKIELPVWELTDPVSRRKAQKKARQYEQYAQTYATVTLDGLPIRAEPVNTAKQVYRLKKDEVVRALYEGKGQSVTNGKGELDGKWLRVLTSTGTQGWCFSHNLKLAKIMLNGDTQIETDGGQDTSAGDAVIESVLSKKWYPDYYLSMIQSGQINPVRMNVSYGFDAGSESGMVRIMLPGVSVSYPYSGTTKTDENVYEFNGTSVKVTVKSENAVVVQYTDTDGKLKSDGFVTLTENIEQLVSAEIQRRADEYEQLRIYGPQFKSSNYGKLTLSDGGAFTWNGFDLLVPDVIKKSASSNGAISIKYFIAGSLKDSYDGVLSFKFNGMDSEVNFLYKMADGGLRLEDATQAILEDGVVTSRGPSPVVIFFNRGK